MKKDNIIPYVWILLPYTLILTTPYFPQSLQNIIPILSIILLIAGIFLQEAYLKIKYASFKIIKGYILNTKQEFTFFVKNFIEETSNNTIKTTLILARPFEHQEFGKIDKVIIYSNKPLLDILDFIPREKAIYIYSMEIDHPSVAYAILNEEEKVIVDHAKPIPTYKLIISDKTIDITHNKKQIEIPKDITTDHKKCLEQLLQTLADYKEEHQKVIRLEEENAGLRNEVEALLKSKMDFQKQVVEGIIAYREAYGDLIKASEELSKKSITDYTPLILPITILGSLYIIAKYYSNVFVWIGSHPLQTLLIAISLAIITYFPLKALKRRK